MEILKRHKCFSGAVQFYAHESQQTGTRMKFSIFLPAGKLRGCLIWLSGLTCTDENFMAKGGSQKTLAELGLMVVCPDTSPRGLNLPNEHDSWDFGSGAGFYLDATTPGYRDHYRMYSYVSNELYGLIQNEFHMEDRISIMGHSMGGHGALVLGLREPHKYKSISAMAPIANPTRCPWGHKAFTGYLGDDQEQWRRYDACELLLSGASHPQKILVDQGTTDEFLQTQLLTANFVQTCHLKKQPLEMRLQEDYDHSFYFVSTFIADHIRFHGQYLDTSRP